MIIPALLTHSKQEFESKLKSIENVVEIAQIDIMDNTLVEGTTFFDPHELVTIKTSLHYELHFMVDAPTHYFESFATIPNVKRIYFHIECAEDPTKIIEEITYHGWDIGITLNPETPTEKITPYIDKCDYVMFMGVTPGASGRPFHENTVKKIQDFHTAFPHISIAVDGGVNESTIKLLQHTGTTLFCAGSAIFNDINTPHANIENLQKIIST